jgi:dTDP-4-dehydrorhamnose reductase
MRLLVTGLSGTLAPHLAAAAERGGHEVLDWPRQKLDAGDPAAMKRQLEQLKPDAIAHLALGPEAWGCALALHAAQHALPMLLVSTAMVFHHEPDGPHRPGDVRNAQDDYGRYKIRCEDTVRAACPEACIVRIGWQIDVDSPSGNNMLAHLDAQQAAHGHIRASRLWRPACSFMKDTAAALLQLVSAPHAGVVHLDSNADDALDFADLVRRLARHADRPHWQVLETEDHRHDQRLLAEQPCPPALPPLSSRLQLVAKQ